MARHRAIVAGDHVATPAGSPARVVSGANGNLSRCIVVVNGHRMFIAPERLTLISSSKLDAPATTSPRLQDLTAHYVPALAPFWKG